MKQNYFLKTILAFFILLYSSLISFDVCAKNNLVYDQIEKIELDNIASNLKVTDTIIKSSPDSKKENTVKTTTPQKKFFGKVYSYGLPPADELGPCEVGVFKEYYIFGVKLFKPKPVMTPLEGKEEILSQEVVACGEEYIPLSAKEKKSKRKKNKEDKIVKTETETTNEIKEKRIRKENDFLDGL